MPSVDNRVVRMEFDNAQFERKIASTLASLQKLNAALKVDASGAAGKGLAGITAAAGKVNFDGISQGIEGISKKFLALSTIAITALAQITTAALRAGANFAKSFSFGPVQAGFQEFELNMKSIQTILSNTKADNTNLEQVNAALDQLNEYSDKTIYNFGEMARNIGTFTAAGVDLDTSVQSIKGIANLAAISGSTSEQAATAMYQLSQAISAGTVRLIDWNSVVNAGMGGEVFQNALFETGKAMGTLTDVPLDQSFKEWTDAGNTFRGSLEQEWLTGEVLTTTLQGIAGEMTEAELVAKGFSAEAAKAMIELGENGIESATKVRTFTQLMGTLKESVASGWSASFREIIGGFDDSTKLFTGLSDAIGGYISRTADARNAMLQTWVKLGGRMVVIEGLQIGFRNLMKLLSPIKEAFRELFPPLTGERLFAISLAFNKLMKALEPSDAVVAVVKAVFTAFFSVLKIGWTIIKEGVKFIASLFGAFGGVNTDAISDIAEKIADFFKGLADGLVKGEGIKNFFKDLADSIGDLPSLLSGVKDAVVGFFTGIDPKVPDGVADSMGRFSQRFQGLKTLFAKIGDIWGPFSRALGKIVDVLENVWVAIRDWFKSLGQKIADNMDEGDFNAVMDALNVALLGGIAGLLAKFFKSGFKFDIGDGLFKKIGKSFEELTGVLTAMQTNIKADALLKIAGAIAILTASVLVLSLIDSAALTKALTAMAVGFGQLLGAFAILSKLAVGPISAASFVIIAAGLTVLAGALLLLALSVKIFGSMEWDELAKGLTGVVVLLGAMALASIPLGAASGAILRAGLAMIPLALAMLIMGKAVAIFGAMSWDEIGKGLVGMVTGILALGLAMKAFPQNMALSAVGLFFLAQSLDKIAAAVKTFSGFSWGEIVKGITGMGLALAAIGLAMQTFPATTPLIAAGLYLMAPALALIAGVVKLFSLMKWGEIARGLVGMGGALLVLALGLTAMAGSLPGAIALGIAAVSMGLMLQVIKQFAKVKFGDLIKGLGSMALGMGILAAASLLLAPAIPFMFLLGVAMVALGVGFALLGVGSIAVAKAFELFAKVGPKGAEAFTEAMKTMAKAIPVFLQALAEGIVEMFKTFAELAPTLAESLRIILESVIKELITLIPRLKELLSVLLTNVIDLLREKIPEYAQMGIDIIKALLQGIRDNIGEVVTIVGEIIVAFLEALEAQVPIVVSAGVDLWITMVTSIAEGVGRVAATLMFGLAAAFIRGFLDGLNQHLPGVMQFFTSLPGKIIGWVGNVLRTLATKGAEIIGGFFAGITERIVGVTNYFRNLGRSILGWIGSLASTIKSKGFELIVGFWTGIQDRITGVIAWFGGLGSRILSALGDIGDILVNIGRTIIGGLWRGMKEVWDNSVAGWLAGRAGAIIEKKGPPKDDAKILIKSGQLIMEGLWGGMKETWSGIESWLSGLASTDVIDGDQMKQNFQRVLDSAAASISDMNMAQPVITPVLDLTQVMAGAAQIPGILGPSVLAPGALSSAKQISFATTSTPADDPAAIATPGDVVFQQTINAPTKLSTADIYKQTRNQITLAKEELSIP